MYYGTRNYLKENNILIYKMTSTSEIDMLLGLKQSQERPLSVASLDKYKKQYNYLTNTNNLSGDWVTDTEEKELIDLIKSLNIKSSGKMGYLNVIVLIKQMNNQSIKELTKYRGELSIIKNNVVKTINQNQTQNLPSYIQVDNFIKMLYKDGDWIRYLYNWLIFSYGLRNNDVNLEIISAEKFNKMNDIDKLKNNYLVVKKTECELVIFNYKTKDLFGAKRIKIRSRRILKVCDILGDGLILIKSNNEPVNDIELSNYLKLYTSDGYNLNEKDYFKINLLYIQSQPNCIRLLKEICDTRGTKNFNWGYCENPNATDNDLSLDNISKLL